MLVSTHSQGGKGTRVCWCVVQGRQEGDEAFSGRLWRPPAHGFPGFDKLRVGEKPRDRHVEMFFEKLFERAVQDVPRRPTELGGMPAKLSAAPPPFATQPSPSRIEFRHWIQWWRFWQCRRPAMHDRKECHTKFTANFAAAQEHVHSCERFEFFSSITNREPEVIQPGRGLNRIGKFRREPPDKHAVCVPGL